MAEPWRVVNEGDPKCRHPQFDRLSLTVDPPINVVRCSACGRELHQQAVNGQFAWPERKP